MENWKIGRNGPPAEKRDVINNVGWEEKESWRKDGSSFSVGCFYGKPGHL